MGSASIPYDRVTSFEIGSLDRSAFTCHVRVRIGALGLGDGTAECGPDGVTVPVEVFYNERAGFVTMVMGAPSN